MPGFALHAGGYAADVMPTGASLRVLRYRGRDLIAPFAADRPRPALRGAILAPWPNRTADGRYVFGGATHQLVLSEPATRTAAHGFAADLEFIPSARTERSLRLSAYIDNPPGYPWRIRLETTYELTEGGLRQEITATNESSTDAPIGLGAHPYLVAGPSLEGAIDDWELQLPADDVVRVSEDRMLPLDRVRVEGSAFDFTAPRKIGVTALNNAFTALRTDEEGLTVIRLVDPAGESLRGVELILDRSAPWVQVYTSDANPAGEYRHALAVEPMTCPPDALNSGVDLRVVVPGGSTSMRWWVRAT